MPGACCRTTIRVCMPAGTCRSGRGSKFMKNERIWDHPVTVTPNNFIYKSLSNWACNTAVGCEHACRFCYVPEVSTNRMASTLKEFGVDDPDAEWGDYVFLRKWDAKAFKASVRKAMKTPVSELKPDGNRAIMFCSTTDPYQTFSKPELNQARREIMRNALAILRDESDLRVRILTRSPLAREDFDLFKTLGNRLLLGSSIPTLNNKLARVYEPNAPAPTKRLEMLAAAREAGINVYVAMAPTYPECFLDDLNATLTAIKAINPVTVFHEPINVRAENVKRIEKQGAEVGVKVRTDVFAGRDAWEEYAILQFNDVEMTATTAGLWDRLHLWPDKSLERWAKKDATGERMTWLKQWHNRISEWPV